METTTEKTLITINDENDRNLITFALRKLAEETGFANMRDNANDLIKRIEQTHAKKVKFDTFIEAFFHAIKFNKNIIQVHGGGEVYGVYCVTQDWLLNRTYYHGNEGQKIYFSVLMKGQRLHVLGGGAGKYVGMVGNPPDAIRIQFDSGNIKDFHPGKLEQQIVPYP